jgi:hypothetical protein
MTEFKGRLRTPRRNGAPTGPAPGELYYDTADDTLFWWDGAKWVGWLGLVVYEQAAMPLGAIEGAVWITDEPPPVAGIEPPLTWGDLFASKAP